MATAKPESQLSPSAIGASMKRQEDPRLITGASAYVDDIKLPGMLYVTFARSIYANANILSINVDAARKAPGVVAVFTGKEISSQIGSVPCAAAMPDLKVPFNPVLAVDAVRYVGEPVVAIV